MNDSVEPRSEKWYLLKLVELSNKHNELLLKHAQLLVEHNALLAMVIKKEETK